MTSYVTSRDGPTKLFMLLRRNLNRAKYHYLAIRTLLYLSFFKASHAPDCLDQCTNGL